MAERLLLPVLAMFGRDREMTGVDIDRPLLAAILALAALGLVMMASASVGIAEESSGTPTYYLLRQLVFLAVATLAFAICLRLPLEWLAASAAPLLVISFFLLILVLVPGVGQEVNGATRWIPLGPVNMQVSEFARLFLLIYFAAFLERHGTVLRESVRPMLPVALIMAVVGALLLAQPDFGALGVFSATLGGILFIAGVPMLIFLALVGITGLAGTLLVLAEPYRLERITSFTDPWADPFASGFQLTQSLIAVGRGEWLGVGLGDSVQKLFYLPEAHTDFLFAVLAEELGVIGMAVTIGLYAFIVWRACRIGAASLRGGRHFGGLLAYGVGIAFGLQAFVNMGVNLGLLPTKGLTLPLMSYGGSSLVASALGLGLLMRADLECRRAGRAASRRARRRSS
ncbi:putative lipid II flippase FtsW [Spiribacter vilamensis]|uniref:Probable peptidoglycan glycosyltransferase FtsW n=1 Tax=Spiribacter vilamensis TaxID=531306 RepID=A0A4Q8CYA2_9GAMM|nr:putative lipid II flippase FtsW [Spiribacter vilamensis]RZU97912.1 cell division-specific peptidoglycan biosynthesis regulator FtsW [Spiribacter vilamensis]TVO61174.1 putative lipid II flippase FtsW [Spiribacter vilamensis]